MNRNREILTGPALLMLLLILSVLNSVDLQAQTITLAEHTLTVKVSQAPLKGVLKEIAFQGNLEIRFLGNVDDVITAELEGVPLEEALTLLVRNYNHVVRFKKAGDTGQQEVSGVYLFSRTGRDDSPLIWKQEAEEGQTSVANMNMGIVTSSIDKGILLDSQTPLDTDPMLSMKAIDPLARFEDPAFQDETGQSPVSIGHARYLLYGQQASRAARPR